MATDTNELAAKLENYVIQLRQASLQKSDDFDCDKSLN